MAWTWDPFRELDALRREIDRSLGFGDGGWRFPFSRFSFLPGRAARGYPLLNLSEDGDNFYVEALAPGIDLATLKVAVVRDQLQISGAKHEAGRDAKPEAFHRNERAAGRFVRTIALPAEVDEAKVKAEYNNGLLTITLPKHERAKPRQITVNVA
ncbi:MAG: Hsp20/alpha crystallin family protein [bacterium]|nr:Hsp20/alpha crystallin family protein [bacterium]